MKMALAKQKSILCIISGERTMGNCRGDPGAGKELGRAGDHWHCEGENIEGKIQVVFMQELRMSLASFDCHCKETDCRLSTKHHIDQVRFQWMLAVNFFISGFTSWGQLDFSGWLCDLSSVIWTFSQQFRKNRKFF